LKQNAVDYRNSLTIENNLRSKKRYIISKTSTTFPPPKNAWGMRRDKHDKKLESNYAGTLPGSCLLHHKGIENV